MSIIVIIRRVIAVLNLPRTINNYTAKVKAVWQAAQASTWMTGTTWPPNVTLHIKDLEDAEVAVESKIPGAVAVRNAKKVIVDSDMRKVRGLVQDKADGDPANAETIVTSCELHVKKIAIRQKQDDAVKAGETSGTVILLAKDGGPHEWQQSPDTVAITNLPSTSGAKTSVTDLTPGTFLYFRNRKILTKGRKGDWCEWIKFMIR